MSHVRPGSAGCRRSTWNYPTVFAGAGAVNLIHGPCRAKVTVPLGKAVNTETAAHRDGYLEPFKDVAIDETIVGETSGGRKTGAR